MINHVRTLLLNRQSSYFVNVPDAPYIPIEFGPAILDNTLQLFKNIIVPISLDPHSEAAVATALMTQLHCSELVNYVTMLDSRYTYKPITDASSMFAPAIDMIFTSAQGCDITPTYVALPAELPFDMAWSGMQHWTITPVNNSSVLVRNPRHENVVYSVVGAGGHVTRSKSIALVPGYLSLYFTMPTGVLTGEFTVTLDTVLPVPYNVAERNAAINNYLVQPKYSERVFRAVGPYAPTILELLDAWRNTAEITVQYGSTLLAYALQCENLRLEI